MEIKSYYWLLIIAPICLGMKARLVAQDVPAPCGYYSFASNEHPDKTYSGPEENGSFFRSLLSFNDWPREKKVIALNAATVGAITAVGFAGWDCGSHAFRTANENWFDSDTPYGGADKLGHVFTCYALASVYIGLNVTYLLERHTGHRARGIFDYYQMPYTYLPARWECD